MLSGKFKHKKCAKRLISSSKIFLIGRLNASGAFAVVDSLQLMLKARKQVQIDAVAQRNPRLKTRIKNCEVRLDHFFVSLVPVCKLAASSQVLVEFLAGAVTVNASRECLGKEISAKQ